MSLRSEFFWRKQGKGVAMITFVNILVYEKLSRNFFNIFSGNFFGLFNGGITIVFGLSLVLKFVERGVSWKFFEELFFGSLQSVFISENIGWEFHSFSANKHFEATMFLFDPAYGRVFVGFFSSSFAFGVCLAYQCNFLWLLSYWFFRSFELHYCVIFLQLHPSV